MNKKAPIYITLLSSLLLWNCSKDPKSETATEATTEKVVDIVHVSEAQAKNIQLPVGVLNKLS
jgi:hypothetical protein